jgi:hypothetical protein
VDPQSPGQSRCRNFLARDRRGPSPRPGSPPGLRLGLGINRSRRWHVPTGTAVPPGPAAAAATASGTPSLQATISVAVPASVAAPRPSRQRRRRRHRTGHGSDVGSAIASDSLAGPTGSEAGAGIPEFCSTSPTSESPARRVAPQAVKVDAGQARWVAPTRAVTPARPCYRDRDPHSVIPHRDHRAAPSPGQPQAEPAWAATTGSAEPETPRWTAPSPSLPVSTGSSESESAASTQARASGLLSFLNAGRRNAQIMRSADRPDYAARVETTRVRAFLGLFAMKAKQSKNQVEVFIAPA